MKTSYYAKCCKDPNAVGISAVTPGWYDGDVYKLLAPSYDLLRAIKNDEITKAEYAIRYKREVLDNLDPQEVYDYLGPDSILLCWEKESKYCHRRLVAYWFKQKLGIEVDEYKG